MYQKINLKLDLNLRPEKSLQKDFMKLLSFTKKIKFLDLLFSMICSICLKQMSRFLFINI